MPYSGSEPKRRVDLNHVKSAFRLAKARLKVAYRSLLFFDPDFSRPPQGGNYLGPQRVLGKQTYAHTRGAHERILAFRV